MSTSVKQTGVACSICNEPITSRKELVIRYEGLTLIPSHYKCHTERVMRSGQHWQKSYLNVVNSFWMSIVTPANWFWSLCMQIAAYFKFKRKVPK